MRYGLIGEHLSHSYSPALHQRLGSVPYSLFPMNQAEFLQFMRQRDFAGVNVTIPYKQQVMPFCDELDETAQRIGAVNTLVNRNGRLHGHNTDAAGLTLLLQRLLPSLKGKTALVLGNGGTCRTACAVLATLGAGRVFVASRQPKNGTLSYAQAEVQTDVALIVNTTPVGMYPHNGKSPLSLAGFPQLEAVADAIYNPAHTALVLEAKRRGLPAAGGLVMLAEQARVSSGLFTGQMPPPEMTDILVGELQKQLYNIVLIGMPGCGKSSLGRQLAQRSGREFVDLDTVITNTHGRPPSAIIEQDGEAAFRQLETLAAQQVGRKNRQVIATGGGTVLRAENVEALRQNGILLWIDCPVEWLSIGQHRPLSQNPENLKRLEVKRKPLYQAAADGTIRYHPNYKKNISRLFLKASELLEHPTL